MIGSACKYFGWDENDVMNMTYEKFTMYLSTIPDFSNKDDTEGPAKHEKSKQENVGSFNLFDFDLM